MRKSRKRKSSSRKRMPLESRRKRQSAPRGFSPDMGVEK